MFEIIEFIFGSIWHFIGFIFTLVVLGEIVIGITKAINDKNK